MTSATIQRPAASRPPGSNGTAPRPTKTFGRTRGVSRNAHRLLVYGTGGIGKTSLAAKAPAPLFADLEGGSEDIDLERVEGLESWSDLRTWLQSGDFAGVKTIVIDSITRAEDWCRQHVINTVKTEKGASVTSIEGYGYGKGYSHLFEEWKRFLGDMERHYTDGRNIVLIAHERIGKVPNPTGEDYIRFEPRLYHGKETSLLSPTKEWSDHVLFVSYDVAAKDGKAKGSGTRTIYTVEEATHMAKTRTLGSTPIVFEDGSGDLWERLAGSAAKTNGDDLPL